MVNQFNIHEKNKKDDQVKNLKKKDRPNFDLRRPIPLFLNYLLFNSKFNCLV